MAKIFFTSDLLFGRAQIAKQRGFENVDHMEDTLVTEWRSVVGDGDTVYHLGNFSWDPISAEAAVSRLNGKIVFVLGEYDSHIPALYSVRSGRHTVLGSTVSVIKGNTLKSKGKHQMCDAVLCHWPMLDWPGRLDGNYHIHGGMMRSDLTNGRRFGVGCDHWELCPIELAALAEFSDAFDKQPRPA